jgi:hypothetical protein
MTKHVDERVLQARRQIGSEMMQLMYYFIVIAMCVKVLVFGMTFEDCITEFIIIVSAPIYQNIRARQMKVVLGNFRKYSRKGAVIAIVGGTVGMLLSMWRLKGSIDKADAVTSIVTFAVTFSLARYGFAHLEKKRAEKLEKEYEDD